jgi:hypothetical protein
MDAIRHLAIEECDREKLLPFGKNHPKELEIDNSMGFSQMQDNSHF